MNALPALLHRLTAHARHQTALLPAITDQAAYDHAEQHIADVADVVRLLLATEIIPWRRVLLAVFCPRATTTREWLGVQW